MNEKTLISVVAISAIVVLESVALLCGVNGALFMGSLALVGGIAGYEIKDIKNHLIKKK